MEDKRTIILKLAAQGMNSSQIARETGISPGSVYYYMHPEKRRKQEIPLGYKNPDVYTGWNADRRKCRSCRRRNIQRKIIRLFLRLINTITIL